MGKALLSKQWGMCPLPFLAVFPTRLNVPFPLCFGNILAQPGQTKAQLLQMLLRQSWVASLTWQHHLWASVLLFLGTNMCVERENHGMNPLYIH